MKQHNKESPELSRRKSSSKPLVEKEDYPATEHRNQPYDEDVIPGDFDRHPYGWAGSYPQASAKPLIDYVTNEWNEKPYQKNYHDSPDLDFDEEEDEWYDYYLACLRSRTTRRWALLITLFLGSLLYLYNTFQPRFAEERMLTESLLLREQIASGKLFGGVFGSSVRPSFSDMIQVKSLNKRYVPGKHDSGRLIFVGDIHGCKEELQALLKQVHFNPKKDHLVTTGDMIAKGPDSLGTVDLLREIGASCVRGNHEDRILLLAQDLNSTRLIQNGGGRSRDEALALEKLSSPFPKSSHESLSVDLNAEQIAYLQSCPVILKVGHIDALHGNVVVVHAGLVPGVPLEDQDPGSVMTMRTIDLHSHVPSKGGKEGPGKDGNHKPPNHKNPSPKRPVKKWPYNVHWARLWNQFQKMLPEFKKWRDEERMVVVYGHDSRRGLEVKKWSKGLDSGCVSGGRLTALVVGNGAKVELVSVKCRDYRS